MRHILVSTSVLVTLPEDAADEVVFTEIERARDLIVHSVKHSIFGHQNITATEAVTCHYLDEPGVNAHNCHQCGVWGTDVNAPGEIDALADGLFVDGEFICLQCHHWPNG